MSNASTERVLVVPTDVFRRLGYFQGFSTDVARYVPELFSPEHVSFRARAEVEEDSSFKQLIPYVLFRHRDADGRASVFQYTRGKGMGEGRLHAKRSVGIGGHISAEDVNPAEQGNGDGSAAGPGGAADPFREGMRRELEEEVHLESPYTAQCVGLINDDETPVGRVHLGVVYLYDVERPDVRARETDLIQSGFAPIDELLADPDGFETWSKITLEALFGSRK